ncbi:MAG: hypothetical protein Q4B15_07565 [Lachnospiraceae bacterium]|nr:hypothetical protein [Lachnospiraceae bacterium]
MNKKVTLRETMIESVILAFLLVFYYWMWARTDWKSYYETLQNSVGIFTFVFFLMTAERVRKYNREVKDEFAVRNLKRSDSIAMKFFVVTTIISAWLSVTSLLDNRETGYLLVGSVAAAMLIRFIAFCIMDSKGV